MPPDRRRNGAAGQVTAGEQPAWPRLLIPTGDRMRELGRQLAGLLRPGDLVVLAGSLGAGKTTLVQGIGAGLGVRGPVTSPTFVIARVHPSLRGGPALVHADAYRLGSRAEVDDLDLDADLDSSVTVVEWGEGLVEELAQDYLQVKITVAAPGVPGWEETGWGEAGRDEAGRDEAGRAQADRDEPADEPRVVELAGAGGRWAAAAPALREAFSAWAQLPAGRRLA